MSVRDHHLALILPGPAEVTRASGDDGSGITQNQQLGDWALGKPTSIPFNDLGHIGRLSLDRNLSNVFSMPSAVSSRCAKMAPALLMRTSMAANRRRTSCASVRMADRDEISASRSS